MAGHFAAREIDSPRLVAEMLLSHVIGCERMRLYMEADRPATPLELSTLRDLVRRAAQHEPVQYLVGHGWFFGKAFEVNPATLIPRPSTESLLVHVLSRTRAGSPNAPHLIADIGTGTGCIAICLASQLPSAHIVATDIAEEVLDLARRNAEKHNVSAQIEFRLGEGVEPLLRGQPGGRFDFICSNPPYISDAEWDDVPANVRNYEPERALRSGPDGLSVLRPLIESSSALLRPGGELVFEIAHSQRQAVLDLAGGQPDLEDVAVLKDLEGFWRVMAARRRDEP